MPITFKIRNFRCLENAELELAPLTVLYGPNGGGKSSVLYALATLRNVVLNPAQPPEQFFNYGFANLGNFEAVVFDHRPDREIELAVVVRRDPLEIQYGVALTRSGGTFRIQGRVSGTVIFASDLQVAFPYPGNAQSSLMFEYEGLQYAAEWNGVTAQISGPSPAREVTELFDAGPAFARSLGVVPLKRGFSKPTYSALPLTPLLVTEEEIATLLAQNKYLEQRVSHYLEKVFDRDLRVHYQPGTINFSLDSTDRGTGVGSELVNDGFGVNQAVYLLTRCLYHGGTWIWIEEPEIHLHPTAVRKLTRALIEMTREEKEQKCFLVSTHSEAFISALLAAVAEGKVNPNDVACYYVTKLGRSSDLQRQQVNEKGQIQGGLISFLEAEIEDLQSFLRLYQSG